MLLWEQHICGRKKRLCGFMMGEKAALGAAKWWSEKAAVRINERSCCSESKSGPRVGCKVPRKGGCIMRGGAVHNAAPLRCTMRPFFFENA